MTYAIIENEKITNVIVADKDFADRIGAVCCEGLCIGIGDSFVEGRFKKVVQDYDESGNRIGEHEEFYAVPSDEPRPTPEELQNRYEKLAMQYIHEIYSYDEENKIIREYLSDQTNTEYKAAFDTYNAYVAECKSKAHKEIYSN